MFFLRYYTNELTDVSGEPELGANLCAARPNSAANLLLSIASQIGLNSHSSCYHESSSLHFDELDNKQLHYL